MGFFDVIWKLSCQNKCDNDKPQFARKNVLLIQNKAGEVRAYCQKCSNILPDNEYKLWREEEL